MKRTLALPPMFGLAAFAGCHHAVTPARPLEGSSSFTFVEAPPALTPPKSKGQSGDGPAQPVEALLVAAPLEPLARPVYPSAALGREPMPVVIGVHIVVDATGRVASVRRSLVVISTPTPRAEEFRAAVDAALAQWRFRPAELRRFRPMPDDSGKPAWALLSREKADCAFDLSFLFQSTGEVVTRAVP